MKLDGSDVALGRENTGLYHLDACSAAACGFINRFKDQPFFFYLAYRAPHVPLDAPKKYLDRFPGEMPERRRQALAMLSAVDDGVGRIMETLRANGLEEDTLIFLIGDNGAPLKIHKRDAPGGGPGWDGSLNDPLNGEKGMLTEGGIRTPFIVHWKGAIPGGRIYSQPVIALDATATAVSVAGLSDEGLDGVNLLPFLTGETEGPPHVALHWRWLGQSAIRKGDWKYLRSDEREFLFNMKDDPEEKHDLFATHPEIAGALHAELAQWAGTLSPPGIWAMKSNGMSKAADSYYKFYIDGERAVPDPDNGKPANTRSRAAGPGEEAIFKLRDLNSDGKVTWEEFSSGRPNENIPALKKVFQRRDADGDGLWEQSEINWTPMR
jgi:uncharacterized sulfatase